MKQPVLWLLEFEDTVHSMYGFLLELGLCHLACLLSSRADSDKPFPNPLILRPNMTKCWEMMTGSMLPIHSVL